MKLYAVFMVSVTLVSLSSLVNSAALRPRSEVEAKQNNQYPWYYWNQEGQQGQYPPYYMQRCGAQGIGSLNLLSLVVIGMAALAFAGIPQATESSSLKKIKY